MIPHGPESKAFEEASAVDLKPQYMASTLAFMFESSSVYSPTKFALETPARQKNYLQCWSGMKRGKVTR
jgi:homogentisate 1,2-dioxygenase